MNKKLTVIIIILVSLSSIGLLSIQVYWIKNAVQVRQAVFNRDVNMAMQRVVFTIDKLRYQEYYLNSKEFYRKNLNAFALFDSLNRDIASQSLTLNNANDLNQLLEKRMVLSNQYQQLFSKFHQPDDLNFFSKNKNLIDSLVGNSLSERNIKTKYEFGIYKPITNAMILQKTGKYPTELLSKSFVYNLSPLGNNIQFPLKFLLYFPQEHLFILKKLYKLLFVSLGLFFIIIGSFSFSIVVINRQKKLSEMKNDLINNMTHEFKTPISTISLVCEALRDKDVQKSDQVYNSYVSVIDEENKRLRTMAEHILQSATIESGRLRLHKEILDVHEILQNAVNGKKINAESRGGKITMALNAKSSMIFADRVHMTNVFVNILDNAVKYNLNAPIIKVSTRNLQDGVLVDFADNGIGISKANQSKIFDKLYRVHTGNIHNFKGFGLGLSYVKAIVEQHKGKVTIDSELEKGSVFHIYLPNENKVSHG
ncbi:Two-component system sensor histidine kinase [hydrothermal vent metagenome]|uniref:histidine kinase n=1 Tax=hydrothermal vent metagenome TaxID=652676 RepID=A0A3B0UVX3_9ZZZZ